MSVVTEGMAQRRRKRLGEMGGRLLLHVVMILLGISFLMPLAWVATTSLKASGEVFIVPIEWIPKSPHWSNYAEVFSRLPFGRFILNSFFVTFMGTLGS